MSIDLEVKALKDEVQTLQAEVHVLQRNQSSRVGLQGGRGEKGDKGDPGRDAHVEIRYADGKVQIFESGVEVAELVAVPGPAPTEDAIRRVLSENYLMDIIRKIFRSLK